MKVILHDLGEEIAIPLGKNNKDSVVIHANNQYAPCRGCFQCWLKNPGFCITKDSLQHIGALVGQRDVYKRQGTTSTCSPPAASPMARAIPAISTVAASALIVIMAFLLHLFFICTPLPPDTALHP